MAGTSFRVALYDGSGSMSVRVYYSDRCAAEDGLSRWYRQSHLDIGEELRLEECREDGSDIVLRRMG